jgi:hypothetical protein
MWLVEEISQLVSQLSEAVRDSTYAAVISLQESRRISHAALFPRLIVLHITNEVVGS